MLIHIDSETAGAQLLSSRLTWVAVSRAQHDAQIYPNDAENLWLKMGRADSHSAAFEGAAQDGWGLLERSRAETVRAMEEGRQALVMER